MLFRSGFSFVDIMDRLIEQQFTFTMRQDATVSFARVRTGSVMHDVVHLPGVVDMEPVRIVPARIRVGHRSRNVAIQGLVATPRLNLVADRSGRMVEMATDGLVLSKLLGEVLQVAPGDSVSIEVLEGRRPIVTQRVSSLVDDSLGLQAYMHIDTVRRLVREGPTVSAAFVTVDPGQMERFYNEVKGMPAVAGVALRQVALRNFRETMAENMNLQIFLNVFFAGVIAFGVVYNSARVSLSERERELASLRVLGFTRAEISLILLGELTMLTLAALPAGAVLGYGLGLLIMQGFNNEIYRLSFGVSAATLAWTFLVVIAASLLSALVVRRRLDRLDLVGVLKTRE